MSSIPRSHNTWCHGLFSVPDQRQPILFSFKLLARAAQGAFVVFARNKALTYGLADPSIQVSGVLCVILPEIRAVNAPSFILMHEYALAVQV